MKTLISLIGAATLLVGLNLSANTDLVNDQNANLVLSEENADQLFNISGAIQALFSKAKSPEDAKRIKDEATKELDKVTTENSLELDENVDNAGILDALKGLKDSIVNTVKGAVTGAIKGAKEEATPEAE